MITLSPTGRSPDDANAINNALAGGPGLVFLSRGGYRIGATDTIVWPAGAVGVSLVGEGQGASLLQFEARNNVGMSITEGAECCLRDIGFQALAQCGSGALLRVANHHDILIDRVKVFGPFFDGIQIDGGPGQYLATLTNVDVDAPPGGNSYRAIVLADGAPVVQDIWLTNVKTAQTRYGVWCSFVSGLYANGLETYAHPVHGFVTYPLSGRFCEFFKINTLLADSCGDTGIYLGGGGGTLNVIHFVNSWSASNANAGAQVIGEPSGNNIFFSSTDMLANRNASVINYGANNLVVAADCYFDKP